MPGHWVHSLLVLPAVADRAALHRIHFARAALNYKEEDHGAEIQGQGWRVHPDPSFEIVGISALIHRRRLLTNHGIGCLAITKVSVARGFAFHETRSEGEGIEERASAEVDREGMAQMLVFAGARQRHPCSARGTEWATT